MSRVSPRQSVLASSRHCQFSSCAACRTAGAMDSDVVVRHQSDGWNRPTGPQGPVSGACARAVVACWTVASAGAATVSEAAARDVAARTRRAVFNSGGLSP
ncbi:hypothetical protein GCM10010289_06120 [Streptomyces violascens]|nr:hypothetical protein GCM10010289_06120 [Streptomyces violascens]